MNDDIDSWRIDREPSQKERLLGIIASSFLAVLCGSIFLLVFLTSPTLESQVPVLGGFGLATIVFLALALRAAFGSARKLRPTEVRIASFVFILSGSLLVLGGLLTGPKLMMLAVGVTGIGVGVLNLYLRNNAT